MDELLVVFALVIMLVYMVMLGISVASYVLTSYSLHTLAKRRNIKKPWLAWIPLASCWTLGCLANEYDVKNGQDRKWQKALIIMGIVVYATLILALAVLFTWAMSMATMYDSPLYVGTGIVESVGFMVFYVIYLVAIMVAMAWGICQTLCIYKIFESTVPEKALKYIILYILVPLAGPICLYKICEKGYPEQEAIAE